MTQRTLKIYTIETISSEASFMQGRTFNDYPERVRVQANGIRNGRPGVTGEDIVSTCMETCSTLKRVVWALRTHSKKTEQEFENLFVVNHPDEIKRFHRLYATDERSRKLVIKRQLTGNPFSDERIDPDPHGTTQTSAGMRALLETIGLDLQGDDNG